MQKIMAIASVSTVLQNTGLLNKIVVK